MHKDMTIHQLKAHQIQKEYTFIQVLNIIILFCTTELLPAWIKITIL